MTTETTATRYVTAYGDNPPRWATPTVHAVAEGTSIWWPNSIAMHGTSACGRSVSSGSNAATFNPAARNACKSCARIVAAQVTA